jgi:hypothetical protein
VYSADPVLGSEAPRIAPGAVSSFLKPGEVL